MRGPRWLQFLLVIQIKFISSCLLFWGRGGFRTFQTSIYKVLPLAPATHSLSTSSLFARKIVYSSHTELLAVCPPCLLFDLFCSLPPAVTKIHITFTTITESQATSSNPSHIFPGIVPLDWDSVMESKKYKWTLNKQNLKVTSFKISSSSNSSDCRKMSRE